MKLKVGWIGKTKDPAIQALTAEYLKRLRHYAESEGMTFVNEDAMLKYRDKVGTRPAHSIVLLDSRGKQLSSEEFAGYIDNHQNRSPQPLVFRAADLQTRPGVLRLPVSTSVLLYSACVPANTLKL